MQCPMCAGPAEVVFRRLGQPGSVHLPLGKTVDLEIAGCRNCDFFWNAEAFADPEAFMAWMAPAYASYNLLDNDLHGFPLVDERTLTVKGFLDAHCDWPGMRQVLEVGSNRGDFLAYLQQCHGHLQLLGVESTPLSLVGVPTLFNDVHEIRFSPSFDLVVTRQVLEHMPDPGRFLTHLASFLREGALLLVEVPVLENELDEGVDPWVVEHAGHYSERALELLGRSAGLTLVAADRTYQLSVLFRKQAHAGVLRTSVNSVRWKRVQSFLHRVQESQAQWRQWVEQGGELCFYGASNVFLALSAVLREKWGEEYWQGCRLALVDDYPRKHDEEVGGLRVQSLESHAPLGKTLYVVCAMYRYHRQKMLPRVLGRMGPDDRLFAMWTPLAY